MKTIKIIDLLNKLVNGEEVPLKIKWDGYLWDFKKEYNDYWNEEEQEYLFFAGFDNFQDAKEFLNEEVKIIEVRITSIGNQISYQDFLKKTEEEKEIETIDMSGPISVVHCAMKINELIDAVNELKRGN